MSAPAKNPPLDDAATVASRIHAVGAALAISFQELLIARTGVPIHAPGIQKAYGQNKVFCHRLATALRRSDPLATLHQIPGPEPLRRLVKAARDSSVPAELIEPAVAAIDDFEELIRKVAGDRSGLDAIISSWMPEARSRFESEAKQLVFRGMRQLKGVAADVVLYGLLIHPSDDGERFDMAQIHGYYGLRCIRPGAPLKLGVKSGANAPRAFPRTLSGDPVHDWRSGTILDRFCCGLPIELKMHPAGEHNIVYSLDWGDEVGMESARDIVMAELRRHGFRRWRTADDPRPKTGNTNEINVPTRLYVNDLIMHKDAYPDWEPSVRVLETGELGWADSNDPARDLDVIDVLETIEPLGTGIHRYRVEHIPNYVELLEHVFEQLGWSPDDFRAYRTRIEYPIFGSQVQHRWNVPVGPPGSEASA